MDIRWLSGLCAFSLLATGLTACTATSEDEDNAEGAAAVVTKSQALFVCDYTAVNAQNVTDPNYYRSSGELLSIDLRDKKTRLTFTNNEATSAGAFPTIGWGFEFDGASAIKVTVMNGHKQSELLGQRRLATAPSSSYQVTNETSLDALERNVAVTFDLATPDGLDDREARLGKDVRKIRTTCVLRAGAR